MSIFRRKKIVRKKALFDCNIEINKGDFFQVFSAALGRIIVNQNKCGELVVKNRNWNVNFSEGVISFGKDKFPLQFIGSESNVSNTWLWGWANPSNLNESVLSEAYKLKKFGLDNDLEVFKTDQFELTDTYNGHNLTIVAAALNSNNVCYYRCPHDQGAVFVTFTDIDTKVFEPIDDVSFARYVSECIQQFYIDHKIFIVSFLHQNDCKYKVNGNVVIGTFKNKKSLKFEFEDIDGICRLKEIKNI